MKISAGEFPVRASFIAKLAMAVTLCFLLLQSSHAADNGGLSSTAAEQIFALQAEKDAFSPTEQKMDSHLVFAYKQSMGQQIAGGAVPMLRVGVDTTNGMVLLDITATVSDTLLAQIRQLGGSIISSFPQFQSVRASVPLTSVESVAALGGIKFVRPAVGCMTRSDPEGVVVHRADQARNTFHVNGSNQKVGVISDSVDFLQAAQATGDLGPVTVLTGQSGVPGSGEGTAMLEIVYALSPGSQLYFATGFGGEASFAQNILDLRAAGCDIIVDDIGYFDESPFQDGVIARAVNTVTASGALYFSAAGNEGNLDRGTSGTWQGDFSNGGAASSPVNGKSGFVHSFGATNYNTVTGRGGVTVLHWADPAGASTNDYDLYELDSTGANVVDSSVNVQNGSQDPFEEMGPSTRNDRIVVVKTGNSADRFLYVSTIRGRFSIGTSGNIVGHAAATNAFATAAIDCHTSYPNPFVGGTTNPVETFSTDGPRRVFFDAAGNPVTPGNFSSTGGFVRQKPDIAATDGVTTTLPSNSGLNPFYGTSAAAPHAAAIAALLKSYNPLLTSAQVRAILTGTALDNMALGLDQDSGSGIVMAFQALQGAPVPSPLPILNVVTNIVTGGNGNGIIDINECDSFALVLSNSGLTNATGVQASITSFTPGVTIPVSTASFPDIPVGGIVTNILPFELSIAPDFLCGSHIDFNISIKCAQGQFSFPFTVLTGSPGTPVRYDNPLPVLIPSGPAGGSSTITVSNFDTSVQGVTVSTFFQDTFDASVILELTSPDGTVVTLAQGDGGSGQNFGADCSDSGRTTFDDASSQILGASSAPFIGTFKPDSSLAPFIGKVGTNVNGDWQLTAIDQFGFSTDVINCWTLFLTPTLCVDGGGRCPGVDLGITMTSLPTSVTVLSNITYSMTITNRGPDNASNVVVSQTLPTGVIFLTGSASQGFVSANGSVVSCSLGLLAAGTNATVTVVCQATAVGTLYSSASVGSGQADLNPADNTATVANVVTPPSSDLSISLVGNLNPVAVGGVLTYIATVVNHGPSDALIVQVTNILPGSVSYLGSSVSQGSTTAPSGTTLVASLGTLPAGSNAVINIQVRPLVQGSITASSAVSSAVSDPNAVNNSATVTTTVNPSADLVLSLTGPSSIIRGSNLLYQLNVYNNGPSTATGLNISDTLPTKLTNIISISNPSNPTGTNAGQGVVTFILTNLPAGSNATMFITLGTGNLTTNTTVVDTATVNAIQSDPNTGNNSASLTTLISSPTVTVVAAGSLLQKEGLVPTNGMIDPGETVTVLLRLQNQGNIPSSGVVSATLLSSGGVTPVGTQTTNYGILQPGGAVVPQPFQFTVASSNGATVVATLQLMTNGVNLSTVSFSFALTKTTTFTNGANIIIPDHGPATPYPSSNLVSGLSGTVGGVVVTMTNVNHTFPDDVDMLLVNPLGQGVILMAHAGNGVLTNSFLQFDDHATNNDGTTRYLPQSSQILSGTYAPSPYEPGAAVLTNNINFTNNFGGTIVFNTNTLPPLPPYATNLYANNGINPNGYWRLYVLDSSPGDQGIILGGWSLAISTGVPVNPVLDLSISGFASPSTAQIFGNITYTLTISNSGPATASVVMFSNTLPANVTFVSATNTAHVTMITNGAGLVSASFGTLASGATITVTIVGNAASSGSGFDVASVSGPDSDPNQSNNSISILSSVTAPVADVGISMSGPASSFAGTTNNYSLTVTNKGPATALNIVITNNLSFSTGSMFRFVPTTSTSTGTGGPPSVDGFGNLTINIGNLAPGGSAVATVSIVCTQATTFTNIMVAKTISTDNNLTNNTASVATLSTGPLPVVEIASIQLLPSTQFNSISPGTAATVSVWLANVGTANTSSNFTATLLANSGVSNPNPSAPVVYGVLTNGGMPVAKTYQFTAAGSAGSPVQLMLQLNDGTNNLGIVTNTFYLNITNSFANSGAIIIPDHGPGAPYPSVITLAGQHGLVGAVSVTLSNLSHQFASDVQVLLVSPSGQGVVLMANVGGASAITNATLTFDGSAPGTLTSSAIPGAHVVSGTYLPSNFGLAQAFPSPAPSGPFASALTSFTGSDPNGNWSLYVFDNSPGDGGIVAQGWSLKVSTVDPVNGAADLGVAIQSMSPVFVQGNDFYYTITVSNNGPDTVNFAQVTNVLPAGVSFIAAYSAPPYILDSNGNPLFQVGTLQSGESMVFKVEVASVAQGFYSSTATVASESTDLNGANNTAQLNFTVVAPPSLSEKILQVSHVPASFSLTLTGPPGIYSILATTNIQQSLASWTSVGTVTNTTGTIQFTDPGVTNHATRYYRAVLNFPN